MKIPPGFAPSRVCSRSKDELLAMPAGADPYLCRDDEGAAWLIATNPFSAMAVRAEEAEEDQDGAVPVDATSAAEKHQDDDWNPPITCGEKDVVVQLTKDTPHLTLIAPRPEVLFPPILESIAKAAGKPDDGEPVSFNVRLLSRLAKGLGIENLTLRRVKHGPTYWLVIQPATPGATPALGILQPLTGVDTSPAVAPVVGKGARGERPPESGAGELVCSACGKAATSTVSLQTPGQEGTPPVCMNCLRRATDEVKSAKGRAKRGVGE